MCNVAVKASKIALASKAYREGEFAEGFCQHYPFSVATDKSTDILM